MTSPLLALDSLREESSTAYARALLARWTPPDPAQAHERDRIVAWIDRYPEDAHRRSRVEGHLTASALVVDPARGAGLLTHHRKLQRWLQLGGHCDGDANLARAALREAYEESGIEGLLIDAVPIDVDIHTIPARAGEPEHWHLDTRFLVWAPPGSVETLSDESLALGWFRPMDLGSIPTDASVQRLFDGVFGTTDRPGRLWAGSGLAAPL
jgi:8-oxo-dGTP pyrophosphatase MutT (NUDIX family)